MMKEFKFTLVEIAPQEEFVKLTPEERIRQNDLMVNRLIALEEFMGKILRGYKFIQLHHGYTR